MRLKSGDAIYAMVGRERDGAKTECNEHIRYMCAVFYLLHKQRRTLRWQLDSRSAFASEEEGTSIDIAWNRIRSLDAATQADDKHGRRCAGL